MIKRKAGQPGSRFRRYKYEAILEFLLPHLVETDTNTNVPNSEDHRDKDDEIEFVTETHEELAKTFKTQSTSDIDEESETESQNQLSESVDNSIRFAKSSSTSNSSDFERKVKFIKPMSLKRKMSHEVTPQEPPSPSGPIVSYVYSEKDLVERKPSVEKCGKHHVDAFLFGIAPTLKSLNPVLLNQAKSKIFAIVQEFEMKQLMSGQGQYHVSTSYISTPFSDNSDQNETTDG